MGSCTAPLPCHLTFTFNCPDCRERRNRCIGSGSCTYPTDNVRPPAGAWAPTPPKRWTLLAKPDRGGHRFFGDATIPGALAVADESGRTPDRTDDGVCYVLTAGRISAGDASFSIPMVRKRDNFSCATGDGWNAARWLHEKYHMPIDTPAGAITFVSSTHESQSEVLAALKGLLTFFRQQRPQDCPGTTVHPPGAYDCPPCAANIAILKAEAKAKNGGSKA